MSTSDKNVQFIDYSYSAGEDHRLDKGTWREIRYIQGKKKGQPYFLPKNRILKLPEAYIECELRIFAKKPDDKKETLFEAVDEQDIKNLSDMLNKNTSVETFQKWVKGIGKNNN